MSDDVTKSCGACVKHQVSARHLVCRARPPVADPVSGIGRWPTVRSDDFCHEDFEAETPAVLQPQPTRARRAQSDDNAPRLPL